MWLSVDVLMATWTKGYTGCDPSKPTRVPSALVQVEEILWNIAIQTHCRNQLKKKKYTKLYEKNVYTFQLC
jgi:hypothetical protein